jgi:carbamoylphosphate synthase large subunit
MAEVAAQKPNAVGPTVAIIATVHWASTTRLCLALAEGGFKVLALVPDHHALRHMAPVQTAVIGRTRAQALRQIRRRLAERIDRVVPADERAIELLHATYVAALKRNEAADRRIAQLIEDSLGSGLAFTTGRHKSRFVALAREQGLLVPATDPVPDLEGLRMLLADRRFPLLLKQDESFGGLGVRIVHDRAEAESAFRELRAGEGAWAAVKRTLRKLDPGHLTWHARPIALQQYIAGRPANRAVACHRGRVLAGLSVEVLEATNCTGPATVVRVVDRSDMAEAAARMVARLQLSGLIGFDFMIEDATDRAFLLEMNVRPTQICHLAFGEDSDMIAALARRHGAVSVRRPWRAMPGTIAFYPQEIWRDPNSTHLATAFHDVPWHVPAFIDAYRSPLPPEPADWVQRLQRRRRALGRLCDRTPAADRRPVLAAKGQAIDPITL